MRAVGWAVPTWPPPNRGEPTLSVATRSMRASARQRLISKVVDCASKRDRKASTATVPKCVSARAATADGGSCAPPIARVPMFSADTPELKLKVLSSYASTYEEVTTGAQLLETGCFDGTSVAELLRRRRFNCPTTRAPDTPRLRWGAAPPRRSSCRTRFTRAMRPRVRLRRRALAAHPRLHIGAVVGTRRGTGIAVAEPSVDEARAHALSVAAAVVTTLADGARAARTVDRCTSHAPSARRRVRES